MDLQLDRAIVNWINIKSVVNANVCAGAGRCNGPPNDLKMTLSIFSLLSTIGCGLPERRVDLCVLTRSESRCPAIYHDYFQLRWMTSNRDSGSY